MAHVHRVELPRAACDVEEKGMGRKEAGGERMRVPDKWSTACVISSKTPAFPPSGDDHYSKEALRFGKKKIGMYARSKYAENCCAVRKLSMKVYN